MGLSGLYTAAHPLQYCHQQAILSSAYADDTLSLTYCEAATIKDILHKSQSLLEEASKWYESYLLKLLIDKTQFCISSNRNIKEYYYINFQNTKVESQLSVNVLGVTLDTNLSFQRHATEMATKAIKLRVVTASH